MRIDMRMPVDIRVELRIVNLSVGSHLLARLQGVQCSHRDGATHVPDHQLDGIQHLRMDIVRRMVFDQGVGQLFAVFGDRASKRHRNWRGELYPADERNLPAGKS